MKTLNRPMFRYGGPIKEGVMNGIREPKRNGGSMMGNNEGPRRAALVGNPIYPKVDGRTNHVIPMAIGAAARFLAPAVGRFVTRKALPMLNAAGKNMYKKGMPKIKKNQRFEEAREGFDPNAVGRFFANDPLAKAAVSGAGFAGKAIQKVGGGIKYATTTPSGLLFLGLPVTYSAGRYFLSDGKEIKDPNDIKKIKQGDTSLKGGGADTEPKVLSEAEREQIESDNRMKQMDTYKKIMNIKGMKKDATYKALIDASQLITQEGDFKGSIKDGSLIAKLIGAADKRFDKVSDTETALRSLVAKGEIDKEMNKEAKALARRKDELTIATLDKNLNTSFADNKAIATKNKILGQAGTDYAAKNTKGIDFRGNLIDAADFADVITTVKEAVGPDGLPTGTMDESQIIEEWTNNFVSDKNVPDGDYTVGDAIVTIKDKVVQKVMR